MTRHVTVAFRTGGGTRVGLGHVRRCLSLARELKQLAVQCLFLLNGPPELCELTAAEACESVSIKGESDLQDTIRHCKNREVQAIVLDSYEFSPSYFKMMGESVPMVAAIDDLADRELPVDIVINGSVGAEELRYRTKQETRLLLGPSYLLLRREFAIPPVRTIRNHVERVLVSVGGSDPHTLTRRLMHWAESTLGSVRLDVVVGPLFRETESIKVMARASAKTITVHENPVDLRSLMLQSDLALCGGGQTTYELAATGTPAVAVRVAVNQEVNLRGLSAAASLAWVGDVDDANLEEKVTRELAVLASDPDRRAAMSRAGRALVDGQGANRVAQVILEACSV